jgi:CRP-like cAMP-binding protein
MDMTTENTAARRRNRILSSLDEKDIAVFAPELSEVTIELGKVLSEAGDPIQQVYFPHEGMISLLAVMTDGRGIETATVGSEGVVGAMSGFGMHISFTRAVVQAPLVASRISAKAFRAALTQSSTIRNLMAAYNEVLLAQVQQTAACNALHAIEARLARWLLQTRDRVDSDVLPLTQEFLSQMLGVRRTTVNLVARQLEHAGTIQRRRGRIVITDRAGLEEVACECYGIVRDQLREALPSIEN